MLNAGLEGLYIVRLDNDRNGNDVSFFKSHNDNEICDV